MKNPLEKRRPTRHFALASTWDTFKRLSARLFSLVPFPRLKDSSTIKVTLPDLDDAKKVKKLRSELPTEEATTEAVEVFLALSNPLRLRLMHALAHDELCVGDLAHALGLSMSAVSHQLAFLRHLKLVAAREQGRKSYYRVVDDFVARLVHDCLAHVGGERPGAPHQHPHGAKHPHGAARTRGAKKSGA